MHIFLVFLPVRMWKVVLLLIIGLQDLGFSQHFQWLSHLWGRRRFSSFRSVDADCPLECDCPSAYPTAMYCHGCNLQHVPFVPSHIKHAYLQRNQINSIQNGVFDWCNQPGQGRAVSQPARVGQDRQERVQQTQEPDMNLGRLLLQR